MSDPHCTPHLCSNCARDGACDKQPTSGFASWCEDYVSRMAQAFADEYRQRQEDADE